MVGNLWVRNGRMRVILKGKGTYSQSHMDRGRMINPPILHQRHDVCIILLVAHNAKALVNKLKERQSTHAHPLVRIWKLDQGSTLAVPFIRGFWSRYLTIVNLLLEEHVQRERYSFAYFMDLSGDIINITRTSEEQWQEMYISVDLYLHARLHSKDHGIIPTCSYSSHYPKSVILEWAVSGSNPDWIPQFDACRYWGQTIFRSCK